MRTDDGEDIVKSRLPHKVKNGAFLGFRSMRDFKLQQSSNALMPDGGLSPCVIRVLGVGGGGCNAVGRLLLRFCAMYCLARLTHSLPSG